MLFQGKGVSMIIVPRIRGLYYMINHVVCFLLLVISLLSSPLHAAKRMIHLHVAYQPVQVTGQQARAIAVNGQIPAPTLRFKQGDHVIIYVHNHLNKDTAIHWHGILVPWQVDGVEGISQTAILPGHVFKYTFTLHQSGTYWYHAHAGLQEQEGVYGAFIIEPLKRAPYSYSKDRVIVLSDWMNTSADHVIANLKKEGDYYAPGFPLQPSLFKFLHDYQHASIAMRHQLIHDYTMMQQMRMSIYDFNDVAYDAFMMNGHSSTDPWYAKVHAGEVVRLRFIGAAASTIFHVKIPGAKMQMVHVQGNDVVPRKVNDFFIAPGETIDVLVKIGQACPYLVYAESRDKVGAVWGVLSPVRLNKIQAPYPFPEPQPVTQEMMKMMMQPKEQKEPTHQMHQSMDMHHDMKMYQHKPMHDQHRKHLNRMMSGIMTMPTEATTRSDHIQSDVHTYTQTTPGTKYQALRAAVKTNDPSKPISGTIKMELFGYMGRYVWFINGQPEYSAHPIVLDPGKRYRFIFTNLSMMHHPMHIHGHWFILRQGNQAYDPLLHTLDVPPGATIVADVDTEASGQWFFHCHMLYHMTSGMSRVLQYSTLLTLVKGKSRPEDSIKTTPFHNRPIVRVDEVRPIEPALVHHPMAHPPGFWLANYLDVGADPFHNVQRFTYKGLFGSDYHKLALFMNEGETFHGHLENADLDVFYWHLLSQFWAIKAGMNYMNQPARTPYWQPGIGIEGLMPYFIDTQARAYYYHDTVKVDLQLSRDTQITNNLLVRLGVRGILASKTVFNAGLGAGLNEMEYTVRPYYRLMPGVSVFVEYENQQDYGAFKVIEKAFDDPTTLNTVSFGLMLVL